MRSYYCRQYNDCRPHTVTLWPSPGNWTHIVSDKRFVMAVGHGKQPMKIRNKKLDCKVHCIGKNGPYFCIKDVLRIFYTRPMLCWAWQAPPTNRRLGWASQSSHVRAKVRSLLQLL